MRGLGSGWGRGGGVSESRDLLVLYGAYCKGPGVGGGRLSQSSGMIGTCLNL